LFLVFFRRNPLFSVFCFLVATVAEALLLACCCLLLRFVIVALF